MSKLKLNDVRKRLPFKVTENTSVWVYLKDALPGNKYGYEVDFDVYLPSKGKNLQRPLVWTLEQKQELILSVLKGINIPSISVIIYQDDIGPKKGPRVYKVIDGKQRLTALLDFAQSKFPIIWDDKEYFIGDLDEWAEKEILYFVPKGNIAYEYPDAMISDDDKISWFEMINFAGTPQDAEHFKFLKS